MKREEDVKTVGPAFQSFGHLTSLSLVPASVKNGASNKNSHLKPLRVTGRKVNMHERHGSVYLNTGGH